MFFPREFDKAVGEIGIAGRQRRLDIVAITRRFVPQSRIELSSDSSPDRPARPEWRRRRGHAATAARMPRAHTTMPNRNRSATVSSENPSFRLPLNGVPFLRHNGPDERRASLRRQDCVEFA
jgi:hypothetical protein